jgi:hypothetical protein
MKLDVNRLLPDVARTVRRYGFAVILCAAATVALIFALNPSLSGRWYYFDWPNNVLTAGLLLAALYAAAGRHVHESGGGGRWLGLFAAWVLPVAVLAAHVVDNSDWVLSWLLFPVGAMWLTLSPFVAIGRGEAREAAQQRYWWFAHRAIVTAIVALFGLCLIWLGLWAIQASLSRLFGLNVEDLFGKWIMPLVGGFLTPVYWLSTLPTADEVERDAAGEPDFLSRAIGFIGQFLLIPFLLIYSAILLAYAVQSVVTWQIPVNTVGWMVLGYAIAGAATWLVVFPRFMRDRWLVRVFRRLWFWLTLLPIALYSLAVFIRVDAYGLTDQRVLLVAGGVWAVVLTLAFLVRRGDIRLIPGLAATILLILAIGPWNLRNLPIAQQSARLDALLSLPGKEGASFPPAWTTAQALQAMRIMRFLDYGGRQSGSSPFVQDRDVLADILAAHGVTLNSTPGDRVTAAVGLLGYGGVTEASPPVFWPVWNDLVRVPMASPVDVRDTPASLGPISLFVDQRAAIPGHFMRLDGTDSLAIASAPGGPIVQKIELSEWVAKQATHFGSGNGGQGASIVEPWIDFELGDIRYRLVVDALTLRLDGQGAPAITSLRGSLFSSVPPPSP